MADDTTDDTANDATNDATEPSAGGSTESGATSDDAVAPDAAPTERGGVHLPGWALAALVVVGALAIGGIGYAIGNSAGDDEVQLNTPIANLRQAPGDAQGNGNGCQGPMGGPMHGMPFFAPGAPGFDRDEQRAPRDPDQDDNQDDGSQDDSNQDSAYSSS